MARKTRNPPPRARSRRGAPPPPPSPPPTPPPSSSTAAPALSPPFSPVRFCGRLGAAEAAAAAADVEHPHVTLWEWWPVRLKGEERKLAVSGFTEKNYLFTSAPIAQRYESLTLQDEDGVVVLLYGSFSLLRMRENGFSMQICEQFMIGFPYWWETWDSHMESYPNLFIHPQEDSAQFYLEKFQLGNFIQKFAPFLIKDLNDAKKLPINDLDAFIGGSRFQEHNCGNDVSTKENSAASDDARPAAVANVEIGLNPSSTSHERDHVNIEGNVSLAPTETYIGDETCKEAGNQNDTMHPDAREDDAGSHLFNSDWTCTMSPNHMPNDSEGGNATNAELVALDPLARVPPKSSNCCSEIAGAFQSVEPLSYQSAPVASLKNQQYLERNEHITLTQKAVSNKNVPSSIHSDVQSPKKTVGSAKKQRSAKQGLGRPTRLNLAPHAWLTRSRVRALSISTPESLKMRRTRSGRVIVPQLDSTRSWVVYDRDRFISGVAHTHNGG
ncbi:uncharacterized protein LOC123426346 isoform X2 [Hordeum vulgare subsp. vulgare]|uniref:uncharacterized protein LOC123426346 isoform X2 n=1 Tax=Hordeum vulgare subsp. vulgare TaxID=112509 RepID=UPI001B84F76E|nr:uncharacterized protein LOC123426346 isoform X2 [Hordeum vulgare subsp. vulgare]